MAKNRNATNEATRSTRKKENPNPRKAPTPRLTLSDEELYDRVARKAYELYQQRGEDHGHDLADWLTAEQIVQEELLHGPLPEEPVMEEE
ncbi:MAG TPA: DUF2934 domain-containing protein [Candidatus Binatia bacterium]|jgi:hypothetical protein|nr:DUF2934 domain-containing protein [Candidatus Binatia bacterium]